MNELPRESFNFSSYNTLLLEKSMLSRDVQWDDTYCTSVI